MGLPLSKIEEGTKKRIQKTFRNVKIQRINHLEYKVLKVSDLDENELIVLRKYSFNFREIGNWIVQRVKGDVILYGPEYYTNNIKDIVVSEDGTII